ncbi:MAG: hypothetical protein R3B06_31600 [Kofleriaceae bacterium]
MHASAAAVPERRWRRFADVVALALGVNMWLSLVIIPAAQIGALGRPAILALALVPLAVLGAGIAVRSELVLLGAFPSAVLLPISLDPAIAAAPLFGPVRFWVVAVGVVAYLLAGSFFMAFHEPAAPRSARPLASSAEGQPSRWRRRERVYWGLTALSVVCPVLGIYWVNYDPAINAFIDQMYAGRVAAMSTLLNAAVLVLWLVIYLHVFLGALKPHRTGDRDLVTELAITRSQAKSGRPRLRFHLAVVAALTLMVVLVYLRRG